MKKKKEKEKKARAGGASFAKRKLGRKGEGRVFCIKMLDRCVQCAGALLPGPDNWLCPQHLRARAAAAGLCGAEPAREADLLRALVFDFPAECGRAEFIARVYYAMNTLGSHTRAADLAARHGAPMRVSHRSTRGEIRDFVCSLFEFVYRNAHVSRLLVDSCAGRVHEWYPRLICTASLGAVVKSERVLRAVRHATGKREFLVLSDIVLAFAGVLCRDMLEHVYVCYARQISD